MGCRGGPEWWCDAALGFVLHRSGKTEEALSAFSRSLAAMDSETARSWNDPYLLLDYPERKWLRDPRGLTEEEAIERLWRFADPLFLTPGNERLSEHYARVFGRYLYDQSEMTLGLPWGSALERLLLRYGFVAGWERVRPPLWEPLPPGLPTDTLAGLTSSSFEGRRTSRKHWWKQLTGCSRGRISRQGNRLRWPGKCTVWMAWRSPLISE